MNTHLKITRWAATAVLLTATAAFAEPDATDWQVRRLFQPTTEEVEHERQGAIMIYDGLTDRHVERALERAFPRVGSMMFVNVVKTDDRGEEMVDGETGAPVTEDDGR